MVKIHQHAKFQNISSMRSPENARKPQIWSVSLSQNSAKIRKIQHTTATGFNHGLPWCVKFMPLGPPVTTKPDGQMKSTTTAIDDSNRRRNKLGLGCSREATAPLILIFKLLFLWLNIGRHFKGITQFHNCHSPKHTSKKYYLVINIFRKICTKIIT